MQPIFGWTQEENDIKCSKLLKCNREHMLLLSHTDREWLVSIALHNIINEKNDKSKVFKILNPRQQLLIFEHG